MKYLFVLPFILWSFLAHAQDKRNRIFISLGIGSGQIKAKKGYIGTPSFTADPVHLIGLNFLHQFSKSFAIEGGINYLNHKYTTKPNVVSVPVTYSNTLVILSVPIKARFEFAKYFYVNGGPFLDFEIKNENADIKHRFSGFGVNFGAGAEYYLKNNIGVFVNPQLNFHNLSRKNYVYTFDDQTIAFGVAYKF